MAITTRLVLRSLSPPTDVAGWCSDQTNRFNLFNSFTYLTLVGRSTGHFNSSFAVILEQLHIGIHHEADELAKFGFRLPAKLSARFAAVALEQIHFGGAQVARVEIDIFLPIEADVAKGFLQEFAHGMGFAGGDDVIIGLLLLEHQPHGFDVFFGVTPVALRFKVAEVKFVLQAGEDLGDRTGDFAGDEGLAAPRRLVIEEDAVGGVQAIGLAVVDGDPVSKDFGHGVRAARIKRGVFGLRHFADFAVHFAGGGLVVARLDAGLANGFQQAHGAGGVRIGRILGVVEADADMALGGQVIDFGRLQAVQQADERAAPGQVAIVQKEAGAFDLRIGINVVEPAAVERADAADQAMNLIAFGEQQLGQVRAVLAGNSRDESLFWHKGGIESSQSARLASGMGR